MPRKAKEKIEELNKVEEKTVKEKVTKVKSSKSTKNTKKDTKTTTSKNTTKKKTTTTKTVAKKNTAKATTTKKKTTTRKPKKVTLSSVVEYYDLPFRYNETVVKILAQTPTTLFIYWDISDEDRNKYIEKYGDDFFNTTKPVLVITNQTMNYTFEVEINDFANSWYLHVNDASCDYKIELGRRPVSSPSNDYIYISSSNQMETPNNHILFDQLGKTVFFRNVKTNIIEEKEIASISTLRKIGKIYNIYDLYKQMYKDELICDNDGLILPSSHTSSHLN